MILGCDICHIRQHKTVMKRISRLDYSRFNHDKTANLYVDISCLDHDCVLDVSLSNHSDKKLDLSPVMQN